jgi:fructooligosaccharide transport system substrate-binding protein
MAAARESIATGSRAPGGIRVSDSHRDHQPARPFPFQSPSRRGLTRREVGQRTIAVLPAAGAIGLLSTGCDVGASRPAPAGDGLAGTFELLTQSGDFINPAQQHAIATFEQQHPQTKISLTPTAFGELPTKIRTAAAAGSGPEGYFHYSHMWRGINASSVMLQLTPQLFRRNELEKLTYGHLLNTVRSKTNEVYFLPTLVGMDGCNLLFHPNILRTANVDPKTFTSMEAVRTAASKLLIRQGDAITRAGLNYNSPYNVISNWILDQGGTIYDEKNRKWTWQTDVAERTIQTLLDEYYARGVAWIDPPPGIGDALANGHVALWINGAFTLFRYATQFPEANIQDMPAPGFAPGKPAHYFQRGIAGYSLSPLLKADDTKAKIGAAFYRHLLSAEGALGIADHYSGAILLKGVYEDPRFKQTKFGPARATYPQQVISRMVVLGYGADDADFATHVTKVIRREVGVKAMLQELQKVATQREEEALRNMS